MQVDQLDLRDIYRAAGYKPLISSEDTRYFVQLLQDNLVNFPLLLEAVFSDRAPSTIVAIAEKLGMIIPGDKRYGLNAYHYFLDNFRYYQKVDPQLRELPDPRCLEKVPDYLLDKEGLDRPSLLKAMQQKLCQGRFHLLSSDFSLTSKLSSNLIKYEEPGKINLYSLQKLRTLVDRTNQTLWKIYNKEKFPEQAVLGLRQLMVEQLGKWTRAKTHVMSNNQFCKLLFELDGILGKYNLVPWQDYVDMVFIT